MELAQKMFLLAAEEMNFTKAAKRAFVTQQCLSEHISKLEKQLHTKLFLTAAKNVINLGHYFAINFIDKISV